MQRQAGQIRNSHCLGMQAKLYIVPIIPPKMHEKDIKGAEESVERIIEEARKHDL